MGHKVGWLTLHAGIAGGADIILLPEIPYDIDKVVEAIHKRATAGQGFTILAVAEGAISKEDAALSKKELKEKINKDENIRPYPMKLADTDSRRDWTSKCVLPFRDIHSEAEARVRMTVYCQPDWVQKQQQLIMKEEYGYMVGIINGKSQESTAW